MQHASLAHQVVLSVKYTKELGSQPQLNPPDINQRQACRGCNGGRILQSSPKHLKQLGWDTQGGGCFTIMPVFVYSSHNPMHLACIASKIEVRPEVDWPGNDNTFWEKAPPTLGAKVTWDVTLDLSVSYLEKTRFIVPPKTPNTNLHTSHRAVKFPYIRQAKSFFKK